MIRLLTAGRVAGSLLALGIAWTSLEVERRSRRQQAELETALEQHDLPARRPRDLEQLRREVDPARRQLVAARALIGDTLDPAFWEATSDSKHSGNPDPSADQIDRAAQQLEQAEQMAAAVVARAPSNWRAQLLSGGARYLRWVLRQDSRLVTDADSWRQPIEIARELAPQESEPLLFQTLSQLELWQMMSPEKQRETERQLQQVLLRSNQQEVRLISAWLRVAPTDNSLFTPLPYRWTTLRSTRVLLATAGRWDLALEARRRELGAAAEALQANLERAELARTVGDVHRTRAALLGSTLPAPHADLMPLFQQTLDLIPPGPLPLSAARALRIWLDWLLELQLYSIELLPRETARRLVGLVEPALSEIEKQRAGVLHSSPAELREMARRIEPRLAAAGDGERDPAALTILQLAAALNAIDGRVDSSLRELVQRYPPPASHRDRWQLIAHPELATEPTWQVQGRGRNVITVSLDRESEILVVPLPRREGGLAVEITWNQETLGRFERFPSQPELELVLRARPGVHRLEVRSFGQAIDGLGRPRLRDRS